MYVSGAGSLTSEGGSADLCYLILDTFVNNTPSVRQTVFVPAHIGLIIRKLHKMM